MGCNGTVFEELPLTKIAMYERAAMGCNGKNYSLTPPPPKKKSLKESAAICDNGRVFEEFALIKIATYEWAEMYCNERSFEKLPLT